VGIPPAPRGVPQIEVTFDIDSNGIVNVSAKDTATGNEQKIVITSQTSLSEEEIKRKIKEAELHAEEDRKIKENIQTKNKAESLVYQVNKALTDLGDKIPEAEKAPIKSLADDLEAALKTDDIEKIKASMHTLETEFQKIAAQAYQQGAPTGAPGDFGVTPNSPPPSGSNEDFVDADYEIEEDE